MANPTGCLVKGDWKTHINTDGKTVSVVIEDLQLKDLDEAEAEELGTRLHRVIATALEPYVISD